jgi:hypothetical protein
LFDFVIIGHQRSGSTFLCRLLSSNPGVVCLEEIFNPSHLHDTVTVTERRVEIRTTSEPSRLAARDTDPAAYVDRLRDQCDGKALGFKLFREHCAYAIDAVKESKIPRLILKRNYLDSFTSWQVARASGRWHNYGETVGVPSDGTLEFNLDGFTRWCDSNDRFYKALTRPGDLVIWYRDGFDAATLGSIADHLQVPNDFSAELVGIKPSTDRSIAKRYRDFGAVIEKLRGSRFEELLPR